MNEAVRVHYQVERTNETGASRSYVFSHPYGAPGDEALAALEDIKQYVLVRIAEIQNYQAAQAGQAPALDETTQDAGQGDSYGN